jgi:hypothetical protein
MGEQTYKAGVVESITAAAAIAANLFVGFDGDVCGADKKALGVSKIKADLGEQVPVIATGIALILSGGVIAVEDPLVSDAAGKVVKATDVSVTIPVDTTPVTSDGAQPTLVVAGSVLPQVINGYALDAASGADELVRILLA